MAVMGLCSAASSAVRWPGVPRFKSGRSAHCTASCISTGMPSTQPLAERVTFGVTTTMHTLPASSACFTSKNTSFESSASALQPPWTSSSTPFKASAIFFWISRIVIFGLPL